MIVQTRLTWWLADDQRVAEHAYLCALGQEQRCEEALRHAGAARWNACRNGMDAHYDEALQWEATAWEALQAARTARGAAFEAWREVTQ